MILAAGLTPAWQQIMLFDAFTPGEVNRAREVHWCASGKVLNVGIALAHLGVDARTVALVGGPVLPSLEAEFARFQIPRRWVESSVPTRVCTTILDSQTGTTTELVENALPITPHDLTEFQNAYAVEAAHAEFVVLSGSLPAGTPSTYYRELLERTPRKVILDARGPELWAALECRPFVVKPNREELSRTVGRPLQTNEDVAAAARELVDRGAEWVVVTHGKEAVWVFSRTVRERIEPLAVPVVNPIGCGDSFAAGLAAALSRGSDIPDAVRYAMAAAADNAGQLLPARLDPQRVAALASQLSRSPRTA
jgi:1-phosphofructokinase family hexose kinase